MLVEEWGNVLHHAKRRDNCLTRTVRGGYNTTTTNNNIRGNVYGAVIMAEPLREFTQFI